MRWGRLLSIVAMAAFGLNFAYVAFTADDAPRWFIALGGVAGLAGLAALVVLIALAWWIIVDDIRPAFRFRKPVVPLALAHSESSLVGRAHYRLHPIRFWGGITLNNRFYFGFMIFGPPRHEDYPSQGDRNPEGGDSEAAPSHSDESAGPAQQDAPQPPVIPPNTIERAA